MPYAYNAGRGEKGSPLSHDGRPDKVCGGTSARQGVGTCLARLWYGFWHKLGKVLAKGEHRREHTSECRGEYTDEYRSDSRGDSRGDITGELQRAHAYTRG